MTIQNQNRIIFYHIIINKMITKSFGQELTSHYYPIVIALYNGKLDHGDINNHSFYGGNRTCRDKTFAFGCGCGNSACASCREPHEEVGHPIINAPGMFNCNSGNCMHQQTPNKDKLCISPDQCTSTGDAQV